MSVCLAGNDVGVPWQQHDVVVGEPDKSKWIVFFHEIPRIDHSSGTKSHNVVAIQLNGLDLGPLHRHNGSITYFATEKI